MNAIFLYSQEKKTIEKGVIILKDNSQIDFINLRYEDGVVIFTKLSTGKETACFLTNIKKVSAVMDSKLSDKKLQKDEKQASYSIDNAPALGSESMHEERFRPDIPEGIYLTKNDFSNRIPNSTDEVYPVIGEDILIANDLQIEDQCYFRYKKNGRMIVEVFAISYKGFLFFQLYSSIRRQVFESKQVFDRLISNIKYEDGLFSRALIGGEHYIYFETEFLTDWQMGSVYSMARNNSASIPALKQTMNSHFEGLIYDVSKGMFQLFGNCKDFNKFILNKYPNGQLECKNKKPDLRKMREAIEQIK